MNEELQAFLDEAIAAGKSQDLVLFSLRTAGMDESYVPQVEDYFKKKRPSDSTVSGSQLGLRPSVSESLSSEYIPAGFAPEDIEQQRGEIAKAAAADLYGGIIASRGDIGLLSQSPAFEESYRIYRSLSDDPAAQALPEKLVEEGQINTAAIPALKYGAVLYANDYIKKEQERQAQLGEKFTIPVLSELAAGVEKNIIGGILKSTEMLGGRTGELGSFFIDDAAQRSRDALIDYGLTEDDISKGIIGNFSDGNIKNGLILLGSTLIQQVPQLVVAAAAGPYGLAALGVSAGGSQYADVQNRSDLTANEKLVYSLGVGAAEYIAERLFLGDVNLLRKSLSKEGIESMTKKELGELLFGYLPKGIRAVTEEGTEEALASIAQQTLGKFIAGDEINPIEIAESAIIGGLMGGSAYVASRGINALARREDLKTKKDAEEYIKSMNDKIADPNISQEEKAILQKEKAKAENVVEQINRTSDRIALAMTEEDRQTVIGINNEIAAASKRYNSLQTDEARKAEAARVQELLNRKTEIENKYDSEEEAGVPSPIQEREAPIAAEPIVGEGEKAPEAGGVLQVPAEEGQKVGDLINTRIVYTDPISETIIEGELIQDGQRLVLEEDSGRQIDIGNVEELSGQAVGEIQVEGQTVTLQKATETLVPQEDGSLVYNLKGNQKIPFKTKMFNRQEGLKAIKRNKAGDVTRVTLQNEQGTETYNLTGREAEDAAYYLLRDFANNMELARLEQLIQQNEEVRAELERATAIAEAPVVAEEAAVPVAEEAVQPRVERGVIQESITKAGRVLNKLIPEAGVKVVTHNTKAEFDAAMDRVSMRGAIKDAIEYGRFIPSRNEIHINLQDSDAEAPLHEAFHAVFVNKFGKQSQEQREKTATEFESGIKKVLNSGTAQDIDLAKEMDRFVKDGGYSAEEAPEEFLAQLAGFMGVNYTQLSAPTQNKLIKWINDFIAKYLPSLKIKSNKEFVDFMNSFAAAANEQTAEEAPRPPAGMPQTDVDITFFPEEKSSKNSSKDKFGFIRSYLKDNDKFEKLKEEGYISENHTLDEFYGMPIILHAPDNAFTGNIAREVVDETGAKSTLLLVRGKGGMFYPLYFHEKGYFWASTEKAANTLASKMNKAAELGDGNIRMMLISSNVDKLLSSSVNAQGVIDILESKAFSKEMGFTKSELKKSLVFGINDIIDRKKKNQSPLDKVSNNNMPSRKLKESESLEDVLSFVRDFLNQDNSIFASRKRFIQSTLDGVSKSVKSDKTTKQFREFLGIETQGGKISSASLTEGFSRLLTEPMLDGVLPNMAYAVLEMNGPVKAIKTEQGKGHHESYPFAIASAGNEKAYIKLLKHPYNWMVNVEDLSKKKTLDLVKKPSDYTKVIPTTSGMSEVVILNQPSEIKSDFDGQNAVEKSSKRAEKAKEQLDKLTDKAKETGSNLFWNKTQRAVRVFKEKQTSQMSREGVRINRFVKRLNAALSKADKETLDLVNNVFDGTLSPELQAKLIAKPNGDVIYTLSTAMRKYIDSFAIDFLSDPSFNALPEDLKMTIAENFGEYMRGSYRFWKDKRFTPSEKAIDDAVEFEYNVIRAKQQKDLIDAGIDEAVAEDLLEELTSEAKRMAKEKVNAYIADITRLRDSKGFKFTGLVSPSSIKLPSQQFRRRKDLPDVIQNLLGKEKDPVIRFVDTAIGVSNIKYKGHMISSIFNMLGDTDMIKDVATSAEEASGEYKIVKDPYSPINGKYVHKDIFEAITDVNLYQSDVPFFQAYFNILKLARKSKVIYNLPTWRKNLTGGWYTMMANGVINPQVLADLKRRGDLFIKGETDAETEQLLDLMAELGLLGQAVDANIIGFTNVVLTRPINGDDNYYNAGLERLKDRVKGADQKLGQLYASVDDYTKLVIFRSELKNYSLKLFGKEYESLTEQQKNDVHEAAAESVKRTTPTFSRLEKFYTSIAGLPFGDFLSFEFEALRSMGENILIGMGDVNKGMKGDGLNDTQKKAYISSGIKRLMGASSVLGAHLAVPAILASLFLGDDDDLKEAIEALRPNWMEGHSIVPVKVTEDGIATVYDYSMEDPYGSFFDLTTDPTTFPSYITGLARPNMGVQFLMNIIEGKDIYGREIVESYDDPLTKGAKYAGYSLKSLIVPPFISSSIRDEMRRYEEEADKYDALDATGRVTSRAVIRDYQYNVGSQFYYFAKELGTKKKQYTDLTGIKRSNRLAELDEVKKMYDAIIKIGMSKGNYLMIKNARNVVKRNYETLEEAYILNNFKVKE
jgi:hypothetical protein